MTSPKTKKEVQSLNEKLTALTRFLSRAAEQSSGHLAKWAVELGEYEIDFSPRHAVKGHILADFLLETTEKVDYPHENKRNNCIGKLHTDGASSEIGVGVGLVLTNPEGKEHTYALKFCFYASNNEVEYEALFFGLRIVTEMGINHIHAYVDSHIVAQQILVEVLKDKSIDEKVVIATFDERGQCWMTPYVKYLQDGTLTDDATEARRIKVSSPLYVLENDVLYRKSYNGPNLRCLAPQQAVDEVKEMHEGLYGLPNEIVSDNGKQFAENLFRSWCEEIRTKKTFTSVAHPQMKFHIFLWAHRTTPKRSTGETLFSLVYGTEVVIPAEIRVPTHRVLEVDVENNSSILRENLKLLEERRIMATVRQADAKQRMAKYYNKRVKHVQFKEGDLVLRDNEASKQVKQGKLGP
ncbi:uncharacterized protein [Rutidosis leptorrhynchoides]|uniref:uncharacterized protein n=1 Tax=Rutidosis leptorrhynchoides TaxID=125765 RepID=UPI003A99D6FF